jgi:hypothetical protein
MNTTGKKGYWPIVQELRPGPNDGEEPCLAERHLECQKETILTQKRKAKTLFDAVIKCSHPGKAK